MKNNKGQTMRRLALFAILAAPLAMASPARADIYACYDRQGVLRFSEKRIPGLRCSLYSKSSGPKKPKASAAPSTGTSQRPRNPRYAPIPEPGQDTPRFRGDEPDTLAERERLYAPYIEEAAALYDIPEPFIRAVIRVESNYRYRAESHAGARGLMQLMPSVISDMGVKDVWEPRANILGGTRLLRVLADRFNGDIVKVLAAYHAGGRAVKEAGGIPYEATESYVRSVLDRYYDYRSRP